VGAHAAGWAGAAATSTGPERGMSGYASHSFITAPCVARKRVRLYGSRCPANLNARFDEVDIEALHQRTFSRQTRQIILRMRGPFAYVGGKSKVAAKIIAMFPEHRTFLEVFGGAGHVLFAKEPSSVEVLNDLDSDVVTFFRTCQRHHEELIRYLRFVVKSREWFDLLNAQDPKALTDIERSGRFFFLQRNAYAGAVRNRGFGYSVTEGSRFNPEHIPTLIENTHKRLARVQIEHLPWQELLKKYDRESTLAFLDPPYFGKQLYNHNFSRSDFIELEKRLRELKGKFVLTLNDLAEVREIFRRFHFREFDLAYTAQRVAGKRFCELLITNYKPIEGKQ